VVLLEGAQAGVWSSAAGVLAHALPKRFISYFFLLEEQIPLE
jgi:hypothetical protein